MFENKKAFQSLIDQNGLKFVRIVFQFFHTDCLVPLDHTGDIEMKSQQNVINPMEKPREFDPFGQTGLPPLATI